VPSGAVRTADAAKAALVRMPRPAMVGAVVAIVWLVVLAALPGGGASNKELVEAVSRHLAGTGGGFAHERDTVLRVYLAPGGSDGNDGTAPDRAVRSLTAAQRVIAAARRDTDVEVRVQQGVYVSGPVQWTTYVPGHTIAFLPIDYDFGEGSAGISGRPIFRGDGRNGFWLRATQQPADARLSFYFLQVEGYSAGGIAFDGEHTQDPQNTRQTPGNGNSIYGMAFRRLGSKYVSSGVGYGAVDLINSRNNIIQNNSFEYLENRGGSTEENLLHGVYLSHHSSNNVIRDNRFYRISGDPIRTRDDSNENKVFGNTFTRTGAGAYFSDWFSTGDHAKKNGSPLECASHGNVFYNNKLNSGYRGRIDVFGTSPLGAAYAGSGCANDGRNRVRAWSNRTR
jgi:hypothetical protein